MKNFISFIFMIFVCGFSLQGCGIKPKSLSAPQETAQDPIKNQYPKPR